MFPGLTLQRPIRALVLAASVAAIAAWAAPGHADPHVDKLAQRLSNGSSFQVRVQAALALGTSGSQAAVQPLCGALNDDTASVRAAAAAGLGRLRKASGKPCLEKRLGRENNESVKTQLKRAMERIQRDVELQQAARAHRAPTRRSRFYVAVAPTKSKASGRKQDVELLVQATIRRKLMEENNVGLAPANEDKARFEELTRSNRLDGYLLRPTVESIAYDGSNVSVALRLTLFSYPGMALQAEYAPKLSMTGTNARDRAAEDKLLRMASETAVQKFLDTTK